MENKNPNDYLPIFGYVRGETVESIHYGSVAVVDVHGEMIAWYGDPETITFLRSTAKPFQALPFLEAGGSAAYRLTDAEIAIMCASHSGTNEHVALLETMQAKIGVKESELMCGVHPPFHGPTAEAMRESGELSTPNRHNCSGKHTGMLAYSKMLKLSKPMEGADPYLSYEHPVQQEILNSFAEMCSIPIEQVHTGIDGCSAPNFAVPLRNAAYAYARICDPENGAVVPKERAIACQKIVSAMTSFPQMVGGPGRFDTRIMQIGAGRILAKGGAEGYQGLGLMPNARYPGSPALGIALKIADGDARGKVRSAVTLEVLRQIGVLSLKDLEDLFDLGPEYTVMNWREISVGRAQPIFKLNHSI